MLLFSSLGNSELDVSPIYYFFFKLDLLRITLSVFEVSFVLTLVFKGQD